MKVVIYDEGFIPGLGRGPFKTPIDISEDKFYLYKQMGLTIIRADKSVPIVESGIRNRTVTKKENVNIPEVKSVEVEPTVVETPKFTKKVEVTPEVVKEEEVSEVETVDEITPEVVDEPEVEEVSEEEETVDEITPEVVDEPEVEEVSEEEETEIDLNALTKRQLVELLTEAGVECNSNMNKATLLALAEENL